MKSIEEYLRSCHGFVRVPIAYIIRKTIAVQTYGNYQKYANHDDEVIARMLCIPPDKNKLHDKQNAQSVKEHIAEYKIDNRSIYDILDQICKDTDLYPYIKQIVCHPFQVARPKPCQCTSIRSQDGTSDIYVNRETKA